MDHAGALDAEQRWLQDVTVAEVTDGSAGSFASAILASIGARVLKVVTPGQLRPSEDAQGALDVDKEIVLTTSENEWREVVESASIVVADIVSVPLPDRRRLFDVAGKSNPGVWVWLSAFGLTGPRRDLLGSDLVALASSGVLGAGLSRSKAAVVPQAEQGLMAAGQVAALASLHGLDRFRNGSGPVDVDVSAQDAVAFVTSLMELSLSLAECPDRSPGEPMGAPSGVFECRDGPIRIIAPDRHHWHGVVRLLGSPAWASELTVDDLDTDRVEINSRIAQWTATRSRSDCVALLQEAGVPASEVNEPSGVLHSDQFAHRGFLRRRDLGDGKTAELPGPPFTIETTPSRRVHPPKRLADTTVVELTGALAGPLTGSLLGAMGAQVVRIGNGRRVDIYQRLGPFLGHVEGPDRSITFNAVNHSKGWLAADDLDPLPADVSAVLSDADVVIDNLSGAYRVRIGLDESAAHWDNLYLTISGFGRTGPKATHRAYGPNVHSYVGLSSTHPNPDGWPWERQTPIGDTASAIAAATIISAWAIGGGRPGVVDLSLAEVVAARLTLHLARAQLAPPATSEPRGSAILQAGDGTWLAVSITSASNAACLAAVLRKLGDETAESGTMVDANHLLKRLEVQAAGRTASEWCELLQHAGVPAFPVVTTEAVADDQQLRARGFVAEVPPCDVDDPGLRIGLPWCFVDEESLVIRPLRPASSSDLRSS